MATLEDALVTLITTYYGFTVLGGTKPANIVNANDYKSLNPFTAEKEWVVIWRERKEDRIPFNDVYANINNELHVYISTPTSDDRLKEITDEVIRVINTNAVVGVNDQYVKNTDDRSSIIDKKYRMDITAVFNRKLAESETTYSVVPALYPTWYTADEIDALLAALVASQSFATITSTGEDVEADAADDTLTLESNDDKLTIVGTAATDTIKFTIDETKIDHDALTNTHNLTTDLDAEIETIIDAELVDGQSIDNAVDALITAHTGDADAHHTPTVAGDLNHNDLANIDADDVKHITAAQLAALHPTYTDGEAVQAVEDAGLEIATTKALAFVDGGSVDIIRDEDDMASDDPNALATQQSIKKYVDDNAGGGAGVEDDAFGSGWNGDATNAPSQNAVYDVIRQRLTYPVPASEYLTNGALIGSTGGARWTYPASDSDAQIEFSILIPDTWITGTTTYLNFLYSCSVASTSFTTLLSVCTYKAGETITTWNIINAGSYVFAAVTPANYYELKSVDVGTTIEAGDRVGIRLKSAGSYGTALYILGMWLSW